jgi:hypothetical protein
MIYVEKFNESKLKSKYPSCPIDPDFYYYVCDKESLDILVTTGKLGTDKLGFYCYDIWNITKIVDKLSDNEIILKLNKKYLEKNNHVIFGINKRIIKLLERFALKFSVDKDIEEFKQKINKENEILFSNEKNKYDILILTDYLKNDVFDGLLDIVITNNDVTYNYCNEIVKKCSHLITYL